MNVITEASTELINQQREFRKIWNFNKNEGKNRSHSFLAFFYQTTDIFPFRLTNGLRFGLKIDE